MVIVEKKGIKKECCGENTISKEKGRIDLRIPQHLGIIPDGNRRWAVKNGHAKQDGYAFGIAPGLALLRQCKDLGIKELTFYGFTMDNTKRPAVQKEAFSQACVQAVREIAQENVELLIIGNDESDCFPSKLRPFANRPITIGEKEIRVNFLVNYSWQWDLQQALSGKNLLQDIRSSEISRVDLLIRWGGCNRLSGFLPLQSVYADMYVIKDYWPDYRPEHLWEALEWYGRQDITLGG